MADDNEDQIDEKGNDKPNDEGRENKDLDAQNSGKENVKRKILFVGLFVTTLVVLFFAAVWFYPEVAKEKKRVNINELSGENSKPKKIKKEAVKITNYEMATFFISLKGGDSFIRLKIHLVGIDEGLKEKMKNDPYLYRDAILGIFKFKSASNINMRGANNMLKKEVLAELRRISGKEVIGEVEFEDLEIL